MIIIPSKKFIFLRVPKTASTSLSHFFSDHLHRFNDAMSTSIFYKDIYRGNLDVDVHSTLNDINVSDIKEYKVFGVVREPLDRILSYIYHSTELQNIQIESALELMLSEKITSPPGRQVQWLHFNQKLISNVYSFTNLQSLIKDAMDYLDITEYNNLTYNHRYIARRDRSIKISKELVERFTETFHGDYDIYRTVIQSEQA